MNYVLPANFALAPSRAHSYAPITAPDGFGPWSHKLAQGEVWHVAFNMFAAPSQAELNDAIFRDREVHVWAMHAAASGNRVATCVISAYAMEWHVAILHEANFSVARHVEAIDQLTNAVFASQPKAAEVWTALPEPAPLGAEEALAALGYTYVANAQDGPKKRTFGLFRDIWTAYQA